MLTKINLYKYTRLQSLLWLVCTLFIFTHCSKTRIDSSQAEPAPKHASEIADEDDEDRPTCLFSVGGGATSNALMQSFLTESPVEDPRVLIIPHAYANNASNMEAALTRFTSQFRDLGVQQVSGLDLSSGQGALDQINSADVIWVSGGFQNTLRNALNNVDTRLITAIRDRYNRGLSIVGGTSAGASIMSQNMITGDGGNNADSPGDVAIANNGFGLWPEVIIDQHFTERNRMWRIENAVSRYPNLIGIGVDESTAVLYTNKTEFKVLGEGTVTVLTQQGGEQQSTILRDGDVYELAGD